MKLLHSDSRIFIRGLNAGPAGGREPTAETVAARMAYARRTNIRTIYLDGAEWWLEDGTENRSKILQAVEEAVSADF